MKQLAIQLPLGKVKSKTVMSKFFCFILSRRLPFCKLKNKKSQWSFGQVQCLKVCPLRECRSLISVLHLHFPEEKRSGNREKWFVNGHAGYLCSQIKHRYVYLHTQIFVHSVFCSMSCLPSVFKRQASICTSNKIIKSK